MNRIFIFFWFNFYFVNAQNVALQGTIICPNASLENIHIINLSNQKTAISDANGNFVIDAKEEDLLVFSAIHIDYWRQSINHENIKNKSIVIKLTPKTEILEEVIVTKQPEFNAQEMGIINYKPVVYTVAERRKNAANDGPINIISTWITGKNKTLKKNIEIEKKDSYRTQLQALYKKEYFTDVLKIPEIYVDGFVFYVVEFPELTAALKSKDQLQCQFILSDLSSDFLEFIKD